MALSSLLESFFKWLFLLSVLTMAASYFYKDKIPDPDFYALEQLASPR
jgi:hypothetical protein